MVDKILIGGILQNSHLARVSVMGVPDRPGTAAAIFRAFAETAICVLYIVQCIDQNNYDHIVLCVDRDDLEVTLRLACEVQAELCATTISFDPYVASLSIFGPDFRERTGIAGAMFAALANLGINIQSISTSISTVTVIIASDRLADAVKAVEDTFELP